MQLKSCETIPLHESCVKKDGDAHPPYDQLCGCSSFHENARWNLYFKEETEPGNTEAGKEFTATQEIKFKICFHTASFKFAIVLAQVFYTILLTFMPIQTILK